MFALAIIVVNNLFANSMQFNTISLHFQEDFVVLDVTDMVRSKTADDPFNH